MMEFSKSLKLNHIFRQLYSRGKSCASGYLVLYCRPNGSKENRVGLTVSAKLGHAVVRNKVKRRLREIYRRNESKFQPGWDLVVVARGRAVDSPYKKLEKSCLHLADKLGVLKDYEETPS